MTNESGKLLRRPKPSRLTKLDITNVSNPYDKDSSNENTDRSTTDTFPSTDRNTVSSSNYLAKVVNKAFNSPEYNQIIFPILNYTTAVNTTPSSMKTNKDKLNYINEETHVHNENDCDCTIPKSSISSIDELYKKAESDPKLKTLQRKKYKSSMPTIKSSATIQSIDDILTYEPYITKLYSSTTFHSKTLVKPFKLLGPDPLPIRPIKHNNENLLRKSYYDDFTYEKYDEEVPNQENDFVLNDFLRNNNVNQNIINTKYNILSSYNYNQICKILAEKIEQEKAEFYDSKHVHIQTLIPDVEPVESRKPIRQTMIEMASYLKKELSQKTGAVLKTKFNPVSKWQRMNGAQTELVIYEDKSANKEEEEEEEPINDDDQITPSQLAVVDCLLKNGLALSLKAHFIDKLPDLASLKKTLIYLNLSFNDFNEMPDELFCLHQLECIKLRSNPIKYLPDKLSSLRNLKILQFSYCQLKFLPECIFELDNLVQLDVAYNSLKIIDEKITNLRKLKTLNYEGNELEYLPSCMLKMRHLEHLNVKNNYLHPFFWKKIMTNSVQSLFEISAAKCSRLFNEDSIAFNKLSFEVKTILKNNTERCKCCNGKIFGNGLKIIKPCEKIFGVKFLPFLFYSCSPECYHNFKMNK